LYLELVVALVETKVSLDALQAETLVPTLIVLSTPKVLATIA
jgi:hypothetical protein